jgi:hypothetical protein
MIQQIFSWGNKKRMFTGQEFNWVLGLSGLGFESLLISGAEFCSSNAWLSTLLPEKIVALVESIELNVLNFETSGVTCRGKIWVISK